MCSVWNPRNLLSTKTDTWRRTETRTAWSILSNNQDVHAYQNSKANDNRSFKKKKKIRQKNKSTFEFLKWRTAIFFLLLVFYLFFFLSVTFGFSVPVHNLEGTVTPSSKKERLSLKLVFNRLSKVTVCDTRSWEVFIHTCTHRAKPDNWTSSATTVELAFLTTNRLSLVQRRVRIP